MNDTVKILTPKLMVPPGSDPKRIFKYYNPLLLFYPMKMMLRSSDRAELVEATKTLLASVSKYEVLVIGDTAYIEYIPPKHNRLLIPSYLWEIVAYRAKYKITRPASMAAAFGSQYAYISG